MQTTLEGITTAKPIPQTTQPRPTAAERGPTCEPRGLQAEDFEEREERAMLFF